MPNVFATSYSGTSAPSSPTWRSKAYSAIALESETICLCFQLSSEQGRPISTDLTKILVAYLGANHYSPSSLATNPFTLRGPSRKLTLPRRLAHVRLEAMLQPLVDGKLRRLWTDARGQPREIGGAKRGGFVDHRASDRRVLLIWVRPQAIFLKFRNFWAPSARAGFDLNRRRAKPRPESLTAKGASTLSASRN
jgi:hypothetical protein